MSTKLEKIGPLLFSRINLEQRNASAENEPAEQGSTSALNPTQLRAAALGRFLSTAIVPVVKKADENGERKLKSLDLTKSGNEARAEYKLESEDETRVRKLKIELADKITDELKPEVQRLGNLIDKYKSRKLPGLKKEAATKPGTDGDELREIVFIKDNDFKFMESDKKRIPYDKFITTLKYYLKRTGQEGILEDKETLALIAYKYGREHLSNLPEGIQDDLPECKKALVKHLFFEVSGKSTARDAEKFESWERSIGNSGLRAILGKIHPAELVEMILEGSTKGENPIVRKQFLSYPNMWEGDKGESLVKRAVADVIKYEAKVLKEKTDSQTDEKSLILDLDKIKSISWSKLLIDNGLKGMFNCCTSASNAYDAVKLGLQELGGEELASQLPSYFITTTGDWLEEDKRTGRRKIDAVTEDVIIDLRIANPELFESRQTIGEIEVGAGKIIPRKLAKFDGLHEAYKRRSTDCFRNSEMNVYEALKRVIPYACGFGKEQAKEWEVRHKKWESKDAAELFKRAIAYTFRNTGRSESKDDGLGKFYIEDNTLHYTFTTADVENWFENVVKAKHDNSLNKLLTDNELSFPFKRLTSSNIERLFELFLNIPTGNTLPTVVAKTNNRTKERVKAYLASTGNSYTLKIGGVTNEDKKVLVAEGTEIKRSKLDEIIANAIIPIERPFKDDFISFNSRSSVNIDSLERFEFSGQNLERTLKVNENASLLFKLTDLVLANEFSSDKKTLLQNILSAKKANDLRTNLFGSDEIKELIKITQSILPDFNLTPSVLEETNLMLLEIIGLKGDIREKFFILLESSKENTSFPHTNRVALIETVMEHVALSVALQCFKDKLTGKLLKYDFPLVNSSIPEIGDGAKKIAISLATNIEEVLRKASNLSGGYSTEGKARAAAVDEEEGTFKDVLLKIAAYRKGDEKGIELESKTTSYEKLKFEIGRAARCIGTEPETIDEQIEALAMLACLNRISQKGFLVDLPEGYLKPSNVDFTKRVGNILISSIHK